MSYDEKERTPRDAHEGKDTQGERGKVTISPRIRVNGVAEARGRVSGGAQGGQGWEIQGMTESRVGLARF
jgi:hypothetical protein